MWPNPYTRTNNSISVGIGKSLLVPAAFPPSTLVSSDFSTWDLTNTDNPTTLPSLLGAVVLNENTGGTYHKISSTVNKAASSLEYTFSCWVRKNNTDQRQVLLGIESPPGTANYVEGCFNTEDGLYRFSETTGTFSGYNYSLTDEGSGWYRCAIKGTTGSTDTSIQVNIYMAQRTGSTPATAVVYGTGDGSGIQLYNPRFVLGDEL